MNEQKQSKFIIDVSSQAKVLNRSATRFFSYDSHTAEIVIQAEKEGKLIDQTLVDTVDIYFESVNQQYLPTKKLMWHDTMEIGIDGLYSYVLPDDFLNYEGLVAFDVYINYKNGDKADSSNRIIFEQRISAIDRAAGAVELVYIKDMDAAKQAVADKADEVMANMSGYESSLADYEHQIKDGMDQLYDGVVRVSTEEITEIRAELPKVETAANDEITKIQAVLPDVQATAAEETAKIKAQLPTVEAVAVAETEKIQAELPKVAAVTTDEITKIKSELPKVQSITDEETTKIQSELPRVQTVATEEIGKIRDVLSTVEQTAQEVSDHADQRIAEYDAKFVSTDQKMTELEQSQGELDAELKVTQQQIADADVYTKAETDARNLSQAWSWSADGTDRFTTVYPTENLFSVKAWENKPPFNVSYIPAMKIIVEPNTEYVMSTNIPNWADNTTCDLFVFDSSGTSNSRINGVALNKPRKVTTLADGIVIVAMRNREFNTGAWWAKLEKGNIPTIYTPAPSEDYANAYPTYKGLRLAPSDNPADYDWSYTDEYVDYLKSSSVSKTEFNDLAARLAALENKEV